MEQVLNRWICLAVIASLWAIASPSYAQIIHKVEEGDTRDVIESAYSSTLEGQSLEQLNPQYRTLPVYPGKELIVNAGVAIGYCRHVLRTGDIPSELMKTYGYRSPFSLGLVRMAIRKDRTLATPEELREPDSILLPLVYWKKFSSLFSPPRSCAEILQADQTDPFLIRGNEAALVGPPDSLTLCSGRSLAQFRSGEDYHCETPVAEDHSETLPVEETEPVVQQEPVTAQQEPVEPPLEGVESSSSAPRKWDIGVAGVFDSLIGKGESESIIVSNLQPQVSARYLSDLNDNWQWFIYGAVTRASYKKNSTTARLDNREFFRFDLTPGLRFEGKQGSRLDLSLGLSQVLYYERKSESVFSMEKTLAPRLQVHGKQRIVSLSEVDYGVTGQLRGAGAGKDFKNSYDAGLGVAVEWNNLGFDLLYFRGTTKTKALSFEHRWLTLGLTYSMGQ